MQITLFLDTSTGQLWRARYDPSTPSLTGKRGDVWDVHVVCVGRGTALTSGAAVAFVLKQSGRYDADPVAAVTDFAWHSGSSTWRGTLTLLTVALDELLAADADETNDVGSVTLMGELAHKVAVADETFIRSQQMSFTVENAVVRDGETPSNLISDAGWTWLKDRFIAGSGVSLSFNNTTQKITITAT